MREDTFVVEGRLAPEFLDETCEIRTAGSTYARGDLELTDCNLVTLEGCPEIIEGSFDCGFNRELTSLEHGPKKADTLLCNNTGITNLLGCPDATKLSANYCHSLESTKGISKSIKRFECFDCPKLKFRNKLTVQVVATNQVNALLIFMLGAKTVQIVSKKFDRTTDFPGVEIVYTLKQPEESLFRSKLKMILAGNKRFAKLD